MTTITVALAPVAEQEQHSGLEEPCEEEEQRQEEDFYEANEANKQENPNKKEGLCDEESCKEEDPEKKQREKRGQREKKRQEPDWGPVFDRRYYGLSTLLQHPTDEPSGLLPAQTTFQYKPLDPPKQEFRWISLLPAEFEDDIFISIVHEEFAIAPKPVFVQNCWAPNYEEVDPNHNIIMVTQNLEIALRHLRDKEEWISMRIDAICIDQQNVAERSHQVAFMGETYRKAAKTYNGLVHSQMTATRRWNGST
ncbi:hypothetical protein QC761_404730 [Podospora bellae-mahoneyi]|uniref:Heterokaryon incompatibility domain-containing protein n=1 Tax=Podospora bellae-mahoneyi TaxID=2093777 RepID=A0ABR0FKJ4_9PEZI|nr:hypothetical protein QC761_404730 [Podospora bellae-mahoneyi]